MNTTIPRAVLIGRLADLIRARRRARVAVDGPDAAGKTTLADELATRLAGTRAVIRAGVDDFHRPREVRYRRGSLSPEGCYRDSFDNAAVLRFVASVGGDAVLVFDGVFLLRPELRDW